MSRSNDDELLALLQRGDPANGHGASDSSVRRLLGDSIDSALPSRAHRVRRRRAWVIGGLAGALAFGLAAPAVSGILAPTGDLTGASVEVARPAPTPTFQVGSGRMPLAAESTEPSSTEVENGSHEVNPTASGGVPGYISFPPTDDASTVYGLTIAEEVRGESASQLSGTGYGSSDSAAIAAGTGIASIEAGARCAWTQEWLVATAAKDSKRADAAASVLTTAATWPATLVLGASVVEGFSKAAAAATDGDVMAVRGDFIGSCTTLLSDPDREDE